MSEMVVTDYIGTDGLMKFIGHEPFDPQNIRIVAHRTVGGALQWRGELQGDCLTMYDEKGEMVLGDNAIRIRHVRAVSLHMDGYIRLIEFFVHPPDAAAATQQQLTIGGLE